MLSRFKYTNWKKNEPSNLLEYMYSPAPLGTRLLNFIFQKVFRQSAEVPFMVHYTSTVSKYVYLGKNVAAYFANCGGVYVQGINSVHIGDDTIFAPGTKIISANHKTDNIHEHDKTLPPVRIGKKCWLGANVIILPGVQIGDNVIIGAGAVVTKSFGSNLVIAGNPAKIIRELPPLSTH